ncbi:YfbU family protein [Pseudomonas sp. B21-041]|uniref:YfbU family protein n=1 Tax=Pseudomonas sp. B21-041 TaxID=2895487 RepID=UPI00215F538F|nr:YfbU family protein [Pseudomonas sp. B21-041]UVL35554.1 YfbU family protein [Pseudomonas sp. B21-041]
MEFSNSEKLIVALLTEIHSALKIKDGLDPDLIQSAVSSGQTWALHWQYPGLFQGANDTPNEVLEVAKILDLWERLERSYAAYPADAREELAGLSIYGENVRFLGFDGNGGDGYSEAHILINDLGRWGSFKGRDLNSHAPMRDAYVRMLGTLEDMNKGPMDYAFSVEEAAQLLNSMTHPSNR